MNRTPHQVIGTVTAAAAGQVIYGDPLTAAAAGFVFAMAPDIDLKLGIPHRTVTHWPATGLAVWLLLHAMTATPWVDVILLGFIVTYMAHIAADGLTISGVPLLGPFTTRDFHLLPPGYRLTTGRWLTPATLKLMVIALIGTAVYLSAKPL